MALKTCILTTVYEGEQNSSHIAVIFHFSFCFAVIVVVAMFMIVMHDFPSIVSRESVRIHTYILNSESN